MESLCVRYSQSRCFGICLRCWRDYISQQTWECLSVPPEKLEEVAMKRVVLGLLPQPWISGRRWSPQPSVKFTFKQREDTETASSTSAVGRLLKTRLMSLCMLVKLFVCAASTAWHQHEARQVASSVDAAVGTRSAVINSRPASTLTPAQGVEWRHASVAERRRMCFK